VVFFEYDEKVKNEAKSLSSVCFLHSKIKKKMSKISLSRIGGVLKAFTTTRRRRRRTPPPTTTTTLGSEARRKKRSKRIRSDYVLSSFLLLLVLF